MCDQRRMGNSILMDLLSGEEGLVLSCFSLRSSCVHKNGGWDFLPYGVLIAKYEIIFSLINTSRSCRARSQLKAPKEVVVTDCVNKEGTQESGTGGWDGGGGVGKIFEKYYVGGGFVSTVNEATMLSLYFRESEDAVLDSNMYFFCRVCFFLSLILSMFRLL